MQSNLSKIESSISLWKTNAESRKKQQQNKPLITN